MEYGLALNEIIKERKRINNYFSEFEFYDLVENILEIGVLLESQEIAHRDIKT